MTPIIKSAKSSLENSMGKKAGKVPEAPPALLIVGISLELSCQASLCQLPLKENSISYGHFLLPITQEASLSFTGWQRKDRLLILYVAIALHMVF